MTAAICFPSELLNSRWGQCTSSRTLSIGFIFLLLTFNAARTSLLTFLFFPPLLSFIITCYLLVSSIDFKTMNVAVFPTTAFRLLIFWISVFPLIWLRNIFTHLCVSSFHSPPSSVIIYCLGPILAKTSVQGNVSCSVLYFLVNTVC